MDAAAASTLAFAATRPPAPPSPLPTTLSAVNEAPAADRNRGGDLAFLLHSVYGLGRYPGYLDKLKEGDLGRLGGLLRAAAEEVGRAEARRRERAALSAALPPPSLSPGDADALLHPDLLAALASPPRSRAGRIARLVREEAPYVYSFPALRPEACEAVLREVGRAHGGTAPLSSTSTFSRRNVPLESCGLQWLEDALRTRVLGGLVPVLCPDALPQGGQEGRKEAFLDWAFSYVLGYASRERVEAIASTSAEEAAAATPAATPAAAPSPSDPLLPLLARPSLTWHTDDSEVTLNISLGRTFEGGEVVFRGLRGSREEGKERVSVKPQPGRGLVHLGQHLHEVTPVTAGERFALILWARSVGGYRASTCPCCLVHRREGCVCDGTWR